MEGWRERLWGGGVNGAEGFCCGRVERRCMLFVLGGPVMGVRERRRDGWREGGQELRKMDEWRDGGGEEKEAADPSASPGTRWPAHVH